MRILYPFLTFTGPTNMCVHFYLKSFCSELFFSNRTFLFLDFFHSKSDEKLIKNTCYIYLHFSSMIYIWDLSGTLIPVNHP